MPAVPHSYTSKSSQLYTFTSSILVAPLTPFLSPLTSRCKSWEEWQWEEKWGGTKRRHLKSPRTPLLSFQVVLVLGAFPFECSLSAPEISPVSFYFSSQKSPVFAFSLTQCVQLYYFSSIAFCKAGVVLLFLCQFFSTGKFWIMKLILYLSVNQALLIFWWCGDFWSAWLCFDPLSTKHFRVPCTAALEIFSLVMIWPGKARLYFE